jgi:hypothetical protein
MRIQMVHASAHPWLVAAYRALHADGARNQYRKKKAKARGAITVVRVR